jgi:hypothetical protein
MKYMSRTVLTSTLINPSHPLPSYNSTTVCRSIVVWHWFKNWKSWGSSPSTETDYTDGVSYLSSLSPCKQSTIMKQSPWEAYSPQLLKKYRITWRIITGVHSCSTIVSSMSVFSYWSLLCIFSAKTLDALHSHACYVPCPSYSPWFDNCNGISGA